MPYAVEQLRVHFVEHTVRRACYESNTADAVIHAMRGELQEGLTDDENLEVRDRVNVLCRETEKLLRSRIPHAATLTETAIELWGYQDIQPLTSDTYIHHNQPTRQDFDQQFQVSPGEAWAWNVIYTATGPYYGVQTNAEGISATRHQDLGSTSFVLELAAALKAFNGCSVLGDLTPDNLDGFTLEGDECKAIYETLRSQDADIKAAIAPLMPAHSTFHQPEALITAIASPLESALAQGIAQFKRGRVL